jgi:nucleoside phosphorylase
MGDKLHQAVRLVEVLMIAVMAALDSELSGLRRQLQKADSYTGGDVRMERGQLGGQDCMLVQSGMGGSALSRRYTRY